MAHSHATRHHCCPNRSPTTRPPSVFRLCPSGRIARRFAAARCPLRQSACVAKVCNYASQTTSKTLTTGQWRTVFFVGCVAVTSQASASQSVAYKKRMDASDGTLGQLPGDFKVMVREPLPEYCSTIAHKRKMYLPCRKQGSSEKESCRGECLDDI